MRISLITGLVLALGGSAAYAMPHEHPTTSARAEHRLGSAEARLRDAGARVQHQQHALRQSFQAVHALQVELEATTTEWNAAVASHQHQRADRLMPQLNALTRRVADADMRQDAIQAELDVARADFQRAKDDVYAASTRTRAADHNRG